MNKLTHSERFQAARVAFDEGRFGSMDQAADWVCQAERLAAPLHDLYTIGCNRELTAIERRAMTRYEVALADHFKHHNLGLYLNQDPRGNPVGIHTPETGKFNTLGGAEDGWRL